MIFDLPPSDDGKQRERDEEILQTAERLSN